MAPVKIKANVPCFL